MKPISISCILVLGHLIIAQKWMNLVLNAKKKERICVRICSKFSLKYEENHKNIVIVDFLMLVAFK